MSDRSVTEQRADEAFKAKLREIDDRIAALESRRTQGDIQLKSLVVNEGLAVGGAPIEDVVASVISQSQFAQVRKMNIAAPLALTGSFQDAPGAVVTIPMPGVYLILGSFEFNVTVAAAGQLLYGSIAFTGAPSASKMNAFHGADVVEQFETRVSVALARWTEAGGTARLQSRKTGGPTAQLVSANGNTGITVVRVAA